MGITEDVEREKKTFPFGWGRFGKALEDLPESTEPGESFLASCVALNPEYQYGPRFVPGSVLSTGHALHELTKTMNVVLVCTSERLIMISTGAGVARRGHTSIARGPPRLIQSEEGVRARLAGGRDADPRCGQQQLPLFLAALELLARPAEASSE